MRAHPMIALLVAACLAAIGQLCLKAGATGAVRPTDFMNARLAVGLAAYAAGTLVWIWALSKVPLSIAYGFTALTFVLVFLGSGQILGEKISLTTGAGLLAILFGFLLVALGSAE
jgi:multidrug transporter EmrE-like cation transporter